MDMTVTYAAAKRLCDHIDGARTLEALLIKATGDTVAGRMLRNLMYWWPQSTRPDGAVYKSARDWDEELAITRNQVRRGNRRLAEWGVSTFVAQAGAFRVTHYTIDWARFAAALAAWARQQASQILAWIGLAEGPQSAQQRAERPDTLTMVNVSGAESTGDTDEGKRLGARSKRLGTRSKRLEARSKRLGARPTYITHTDLAERRKQKILKLKPEGNEMFRKRDEVRLNEEAEAIWRMACAQLRVQSPVMYRTWLENARLIALDGHLFVADVPSEQARAMLQYRAYRGIVGVLRGASSWVDADVAFVLRERESA
jgi:hypothetical protein